MAYILAMQGQRDQIDRLEILRRAPINLTIQSMISSGANLIQLAEKGTQDSLKYDEAL